MIIQVSVVLRRTVSGSLLEWILQNKAGHPMVFTQCSIRNRIDKYRELQRRSDLGGGGGGGGGGRARTKIYRLTGLILTIKSFLRRKSNETKRDTRFVSLQQ